MSEPVVEAEFGEKNAARLGPRQVPIPDDWEAVPFEDAIKLNPNYDKPNEGPFDFLPMDAVDEEMQTIKYWTQREKDECTTTWFKNGDTVYAKITPCTENGKIAFIEDLDTKFGSGSTEFLVFHPREGVIDERFLYYFVNLPEFRAVTISLMEGSTGRQRVPTDVFHGGIEVPLPPLPEQRRIAEVLSTVDERIQETEREIKTTKSLKQGVRQDIVVGGLSPRETKVVRIGPRDLEIPSHWELRPCGELFEAVNGRAFKSEEWCEEGTQIIRIQDLRPDADAETNYADFEVDKKYHVEEGDLLFCWAGNINTSLGAYIWRGDDAYLNQHIYNLRPREKIDKRFFKYSLNQHLVLLKTMVGGSAGQVHITKGDFESFQLPTPPYEEQKRIGDIISNIEKKVRENKKTKQDLQELKRGLMQDLLTGKRRLKTDN
jgi:type I restriction enzyme S subunit